MIINTNAFQIGLTWECSPRLRRARTRRDAARPLSLGLASRGIFQTFREKFAFGRVKENHHPTVKKDLPKKCSNTAGLNCGMV